MQVETDRPIAAERSVYFRYYALNGGFVADGGHTKPGLNSLSDRWYFAEGSAFPGINEYVLIMNPGDRAARVSATYLLGPGEGAHTAAYNVGPGKRATIFNRSFPDINKANKRIWRTRGDTLWLL